MMLIGGYLIHCSVEGLNIAHLIQVKGTKTVSELKQNRGSSVGYHVSCMSGGCKAAGTDVVLQQEHKSNLKRATAVVKVEVKSLGHDGNFFTNPISVAA